MLILVSNCWQQFEERFDECMKLDWSVHSDWFVRITGVYIDIWWVHRASDEQWSAPFACSCLHDWRRLNAASKHHWLTSVDTVASPRPGWMDTWHISAFLPDHSCNCQFIPLHNADCSHIKRRPSASWVAMDISCRHVVVNWWCFVRWPVQTTMCTAQPFVRRKENV